MTIDIDRWLQSDNLALLAGMNLAAVYGATQPLSTWVAVDPVVVWTAIAATSLVLLGYRKVVL